jgi:hypothetical protein
MKTDIQIVFTDTDILVRVKFNTSGLSRSKEILEWHAITPLT